MSIMDTKLNIEDFPDMAHMDEYTRACNPSHVERPRRTAGSVRSNHKYPPSSGRPEGRSPFEGRPEGRSPSDGPPPLDESESPHQHMRTVPVSLDINVLMRLDESQARPIYTAKLTHDDVRNFMSASGQGNDKDMSRAIITQVQVMSTEGLSDRRWALSVMDGAERRAQKSLFGRRWGMYCDGKFDLTGVPLCQISRDGPTIVYERHNAVEDDIVKYGAFRMDILTEGVLAVPEKRNPHMLVPAFPNGMYFWYALTKCSGAIKNLGLALGQHDESEYIRIPEEEYNMVIDAYQRKLKSIESKMHNLESIELSVVPLSKSTISDSGEQCYVSLLINCHMPLL